jgi:hypothetical protein
MEPSNSGADSNQRPGSMQVWAFDRLYSSLRRWFREHRSITTISKIQMIEFNLAFASDSGKYARVWLKDGKSVMESHLAKRGLAQYEVDSLKHRNMGKSEWISVPVGNDPSLNNNRIWLRKDHQMAAFLVKTPSPGPTGVNWLVTSFTVGYLEVLKAEINRTESVGDVGITRRLWKKLEEFLGPEK